MQLQSRVLLGYQLMFALTQSYSNLVKTYPRGEHASDGLKVQNQDCCFPTKVMWGSFDDFLVCTPDKASAIICNWFMSECDQYSNDLIGQIQTWHKFIVSWFSLIFNVEVENRSYCIEFLLIINTVMGDIPVFSFCGRIGWFFEPFEFLNTYNWWKTFFQSKQPMTKWHISLNSQFTVLNGIICNFVIIHC